MIFRWVLFQWKKHFFWKCAFRLDESITFERQVPIWRVSGATRIGQKCSQRGQKKRSKRQTENLRKTYKHTKQGPSRCVVYSVRNWVFQFFKERNKSETERPKVRHFRVRDRLLALKKWSKNMTFSQLGIYWKWSFRPSESITFANWGCPETSKFDVQKSKKNRKCWMRKRIRKKRFLGGRVC